MSWENYALYRIRLCINDEASGFAINTITEIYNRSSLDGLVTITLASQKAVSFLLSSHNDHTFEKLMKVGHVRFMKMYFYIFPQILFHLQDTYVCTHDT